MSDEQHSSSKINRQHVVETSIEFLLKQVNNQRLHVANLLAKTGDKESYTWLQDVFKDVEDALNEISFEAIDEAKNYYNK